MEVQEASGGAGGKQWVSGGAGGKQWGSGGPRAWQNTLMMIYSRFYSWFLGSCFHRYPAPTFRSILPTLFVIASYIAGTEFYVTVTVIIFSHCSSATPSLHNSNLNLPPYFHRASYAPV